MRIAITADPFIPVPPTHYGGIERVIDLLVRGLLGRGFDVTLFAHSASSVPAKLVGYGCPPHQTARQRVRELIELSSALVRRAGEFDLVHSFGRLAALAPLFIHRRLPKLQSYQRAIPFGSVRRAARLGGRSIGFTACSSAMYSGRVLVEPELGSWSTIYNPVDVTRFAWVPRVDDDAPLVFLGRIEPIKGPHHAITIARLSGRRLVIAGPEPVGTHAQFFRERIAPHVDGARVRFVGPVDDAAKSTLLARAAALLMPIEWAEPFGIVMAEALACGAPVIGFGRGSVPEVISHGETGFIVNDCGEAADAVCDLPSLSRAVARETCERRFGATAIVDRYVDLYQAARSRV